MAKRFRFIPACLFICYCISGSGAIITNGNKGESKGQSSNHPPAHLISITEPPPEQNPTRRAESKVDASRDGQLGEQSVERQSLYSSPSHHYPEYHHSGLSYGGGYDFGGGLGGHSGGGGLGGHSGGGGLGGHIGGGGLGGHIGGGGNSLESSIGGGEGGYGEFHKHHYIPHHHMEHGKQHNPKALALKGLLVPLAGVALLGAAAALVSNPILLQLGVITGKKRRRRSSDADASQVPNLSPEEADAVQQKLNEIALLERFMAQIPKEQAVTQEKQLLANYLSCSGSMNANSTSGTCLERLTCELHHPGSDVPQLEKHVMSIVTSEILTNEYVPDSVKERVKSAATTGSQSGNCSEFPCNDLEGN
ncbi:uncharacterized protein [Periplaneta americana]|uniref:uncharacterized protein n=1 Tax=Periplaneta americana TaxID=6978 RepID=UPI0037E93202